MRATLLPTSRLSVLDEAVLWCDWTNGDWTNKGTGGSALNPTIVAANSVERCAGFGGYVSMATTCPDAAAIDLTAGFVVLADFQPLAWNPPVNPEQILAKPTGTDADDDDCYAVGLGTSGVPFIEWHDTTAGHKAKGFTTSDSATATITYTGTSRKRLCWQFVADNGSGGWTASLYSGDGGTDATTPDGVGLTLLSRITNTTDGAQTLSTSNNVLKIGDPFTGAIYRVRLYDSMSGSLLRDFCPSRNYASGTTMTSTTGEVWSNVNAPLDGVLAARWSDNDALDYTGAESGALVYRFSTPYLADVAGESFVYAEKITGTLGADALGYYLIDNNIGIDGFGFACGDGVDFGFALSNTGWATGANTVIVNIDRDGAAATVYVNGTARGTADITAVGTLANTRTLTVGGGCHLVHGQFGRILTAGEIASLTSVLGD